MTRSKTPPRVGRGEAEAIIDKMGLEGLCDRILGGETMTAICKAIRVDRGSLIRWIALDDERSARVREARIAAAQAWDELAEEVITKARGKDGIARARELAHHYRWRASKTDPRSYGEKLEIDQTTTVVNLSDEEIERRISSIRDKLAAAEQPAPGGEAAHG